MTRCRHDSVVYYLIRSRRRLEIAIQLPLCAVQLSRQLHYAKSGRNVDSRNPKRRHAYSGSLLLLRRPTIAYMQRTPSLPSWSAKVHNISDNRKSVIAYVGRGGKINLGVVTARKIQRSPDDLQTGHPSPLSRLPEDFLRGSSDRQSSPD